MVYPWLKTYPEGIDWNQKFEAQPVFAALDIGAANWPGNVHLEFLDRSFTYGEILKLANRAAKGFQNIGVQKGTKVGLFLPNCPQQVIAYYGVLKAGGTVVNYSPLYSEPELLHQIEDSQTDIMVTLDLEALYPKMQQLMDESRVNKLVVASLQDMMPRTKGVLFSLLRRKDIAKVAKDEQHVPWDDLMDNDGAYEAVEIDPHEDLAVLQYTGGTTGTPKGAMLTHANVFINACQNKVWLEGFQEGKETTIGALPFFHAFAMTTMLVMATMAGTRIILHPRFELDDIVRDIIRKKPSTIAGVPTMFTAMANHKDANRDSFSSLKWCMSGGAPLPNEVREHFESVTGVEIVEGYGLTESSPTATCGLHFGLNKNGSIGLPLPQTRIIVVDKEDPTRVLPAGEIGEITIDGPQVMKGYWQNPEATAETIVEGRLRTGDVGYMDEDGYTFIIDRMKDMILVGGFNVYPRFVEEAIHKHPAVKEVTVIGVPDDYSGEAPKAFVVLKDGAGPITAEELDTFLREHIGKHELPREIEFRDELPKTMVGKLSKKELVAEEEAKLVEPEEAA
ncbi:MAG: long-chain-fatty-acid--CoA ligase [Alphaproteobacteria bacterium]